MWILIIITTFTSGGASSSNIAIAEFSNVQKCEAARVKLKQNGEVKNAYCFQK